MPNPTSFAPLEVALYERGLMPALEALATERGDEAAEAAEATLAAVAPLAAGVAADASQVAADLLAAQTAAQTAAGIALGPAVVALTLTALNAITVLPGTATPIGAGMIGWVYGTGIDRGVYIATGGPGTFAYEGPLPAQFAQRQAEVADHLTDHFVYTGAGSVIPHVTARTADGVEHVIDGTRRSDGVRLIDQRIEGAGFDASVDRVSAPLVAVQTSRIDTLRFRTSLQYSFGGSGFYPLVTAFDPSGTERAKFWFDPADSGAFVFESQVRGVGFEAGVALGLRPYISDHVYAGTGERPIMVFGTKAAMTVKDGELTLYSVRLVDARGVEASDAPWMLKPTVPVSTTLYIALVYGQSLSVGALGQMALSLAQPYSNVTFVGGTKSTSAGDMSAFGPLIENNLGENNATGTNRGETIASSMANHAVKLAALDGIEPSDFVNFASTPGESGKSIAQLSKGTAFYARLISQLSAACSLAAASGKTPIVKVVPWIQGEADAELGTIYADYLALLFQLQVDLDTDIRAITGQAERVHLLIYQTVHYARLNDGAVQRAQFDAVAQSPYIHFATPIYHLPHDADALHLINIGYRWLGPYFGRAYKQMLIDGREPDSIWPISATAVGTKARLKFRAPTLPLVLDTSNLALVVDNGLKIIDDTGTLTLIGHAILPDGVTWEVTLNRALGANPRARLALDYQGSGLVISGGAASNLRDSTPDTTIVDGVVKPLWHVAPHFEIDITVLAE